MPLKIYTAPAVDIGGGVYPKDQPEQLRDFLYSILKEYVPGYADEIAKITVFWPAERKIRSALIGEYIPKHTDYPNGIIIIYPDALENFADHCKVDNIALLVSTFFHEVRHYLDYKVKKKFKTISVGPIGADPKYEERAEDFAHTIGLKLERRNILTKACPSASYPNMLALFGVWVKGWTGMDVFAWHEEIKGIE